MWSTSSGAFNPDLDLLSGACPRLGVPLVYTVHNLCRTTPAPPTPSATAGCTGPPTPWSSTASAAPRPPQRGWGIPADRIAVVPHGPDARIAPALERDEPVAVSACPRTPSSSCSRPDRAVQGALRPDRRLRLLADRPQARLVVAGKPNEPFALSSNSFVRSASRPRRLDLRFLPEPSWPPTSAPPTSSCCRTAPSRPAHVARRAPLWLCRSSQPMSVTSAKSSRMAKRPAGAARRPDPRWPTPIVAPAG